MIRLPLDHLSEMLPFVVGVAGGVFALWRWTVDQKWRRVQYAQKLIKDFFENERIIEACTILDTVDETVALEDESDPAKRCEIMITDNFLIGALSTFCQKPENTEDEQHIRHIFDEFFDGLSAFQSHIEIGLIKRKDIKPYLEYWLTELSGNGKIHSNFVAYQIRNYLECFGYGQVIELVRKMGHPIPNNPNPASLPYTCYCDPEQKTSPNTTIAELTPAGT